MGFVGLGQIGAAMAERLVGWPGGLVVFDVRDDTAAPFAAKGAAVATSVREVGECARLVSVMVRDDDQVRAVVDELLVSPVPGTVVAIHSTIRPGTAEELARAAAPAGVHVVDAPVSGGEAGARQGRLAVLVGGDADAVERCREPFGRFAEVVVRFGPPGAGTRAKLARNLLTFVGFTAAAEAQRVAEAAGLDLGALAKVVRHSDGVTGGVGAIMVRPTTAPLPTDDPLYDILCHTRELGEKDLALALELCAELGVDVPLTELALEHLASSLGVPRGDRPG
ncbi:MAG: NAD(P)-dependent oxidoreductase [Acidimicrobiales bacterium]